MCIAHLADSGSCMLHTPLALLVMSCADTGIPGKQDYSKFQSWIMWLGFKGYGQSPEDGAKPLVYACCAPEDDLRGTGLQMFALK